MLVSHYGQSLNEARAAARKLSPAHRSAEAEKKARDSGSNVNEFILFYVDEFVFRVMRVHFAQRVTPFS